MGRDGVDMEDKSKVEHRFREIKSLRDKSNLLASVHSILSDEYHLWFIIISSVLLLNSTVLVGLTFISESFVQSSTGISPDTLKWVAGIISILNFGGILLLSKWDLQGKAVAHRLAVRFYFANMNKIRRWLDSGEEISDDFIEEVRTEYSRTQTLPKIPDSRFLKLKQRHLRKTAISRELDKSPFDSIRIIEKRLKSQSIESHQQD